jgi:hypothetical protein
MSPLSKFAYWICLLEQPFFSVMTNSIASPVKVMNRRNSRTSRLYKDESAVMAWDLMNELEMRDSILD